MLHTLMKGLLQSVFMWTLAVIQLISKKKVGPERRKTDRYRNNLATLDVRITNFPIRNSIFPCKESCFTKGVSCFIPDSKSSTAALGSSGMNATKLEAQKYLSILFQLMICIGMYDECVMYY
jgi:hypothetical protein